jgi:N-carbamoylputrescine amidase
MMGHAAANMIPVVASNRIGTEILLDQETKTEKQRITFYGKTFITDNTGACTMECSTLSASSTSDTEASTNNSEGFNPFEVISTQVNITKNHRTRSAWGLFRDRRPDLYRVLLTKDGNH